MKTSLTDKKILFVSRAYPPVIGGIESQNYELSQWLPKYAHVTTIANKKGKIALPLFLPWLIVTLPFRMRSHDILLLGDGVLCIVGWWIKKIMPKKKVVSIIHGLDITYESALYQILWVLTFIPACDTLIAVGNHTITEGVAHGITKNKFIFIPNGVDSKKLTTWDGTQDDLWTLLGNDYSDRQIILTTGRLARRKGVAWFIRHVLPSLPENTLYVIAGAGPDEQNVKDAIDETSTHDRTILLGRVKYADLTTLWHTCDIFVQPNVHVRGDMEGFGISVIEAIICGTPVLASDLEGLKDAIVNGKSGFMVAPENPDAWIAKITEILAPDFDSMCFGAQASSYVQKHNDWDLIAKKYIAEITS